MKTFWKTLIDFRKWKWKRNQVIFEKDFEIRNQKDLIENYFEKDVVKKIWLVLKKMWLRRYDLKNILKKIWFFFKLKTWLTRKDMIQTLNLSQQKRQHTWNVESNH